MRFSYSYFFKAYGIFFVALFFGQGLGSTIGKIASLNAGILHPLMVSLVKLDLIVIGAVLLGALILAVVLGFLRGREIADGV